MKKILIIGSIAVVLIIGTIFFFKYQASKSEGEVPKTAEEGQENIPPGAQAEIVTSTVPEVIVDDLPNDKDRDGLLDTEEEQLGLSDKSVDSDDDLLSDTEEINKFKTDPKKKDTDGDGYADGYEVLSGFNPNGPGKLPTAQ